MKIEKRVCDRCGKEIVFYPMIQMTQTQFPVINITISDTLLYQSSIDLCENCKIEFLSWLDELKKNGVTAKSG